jgi:hypothetical protein
MNIIGMKAGISRSGFKILYTYASAKSFHIIRIQDSKNNWKIMEVYILSGE